MRYHILVAACASLGAFVCAPSAAATTLQQAMQMAADSHPQSNIAGLRVEAASGLASEQAAYAYNPELSLEPQRRRLAGGGRSNDYSITLSQGIETGGKHAYRQAAAASGLDAARAFRQATQQGLMTAAASAYVNLVYARKAEALGHRVSDLYRQVTEWLERRQRAGETSRLDVHLMQSAYASSLHASVMAEQDLLLSRQQYLARVGQPAPKDMALPRMPQAWLPASDPDELAWTSRPDLQALRLQADQAASLARLAGANRVPDLAVSVMSGREAGDHLLKLGVTLPFPVLNSHRGAYRAALAEQELSQRELDWAKHRLHAEVERALQSHAMTTRAALTVEAASIMHDSDEAIRLARKAYELGELEPEEMVLRIRQAVDAQLASMQISQQAWLARIRLAEVMGRPNIIIEGDHHE